MMGLLNDMLDMKLIEQNQFQQKLANFAPEETFNFVIEMLKAQF